jgi:TonB family protein
MLRYSWAWLATTLLLVPSMAKTASQPIDVAVLHAEAPEYPPGPALAISGTVTVRVAIDQQGKVTSSEVEHSLPLLAGYAETAARQWIFDPDYGSGTREVLLSFVFAGVRQTEEPSYVETAP